MITNCFLYREALVSRRVGSELKSVLDMGGENRQIHKDEATEMPSVCETL